MTVSYQYDVASSASGGFIRLLFRWRGSVWKVVYREMLIFTVCYIMLTILYNFALGDPQQRIFEKVVYFCSTFMDLIPLSFMLGFYVSFIAARWWSQFIAIPWPDKLMNIVAMYIPGLDESSRVVRRTLMRYLNLSLVLVLRSISMAVKRRFPTKEHLIEAGFMTKTELEMFQSVPSTEFNTFWIPCTWFINVLREARQECRITDSNGLKLIMEELNEFRSKCGLLWGYDWISIPLVYTQVVTMATYAFYVACMFGRQKVNIISEKASSPEVHRYDYYVPIFTILQLMFYMGLLKVAEQLINPFGDDDEDFELNWIIDRHMKVSYLGVDTLNGTPPPLVKDTYYNELDVKIPYTEASKGYKKKTYRGSVAYMQVPMEQQGMVLPDMSEEEDDGETISENMNMGLRRPSVYSLFQSRGSGPKVISPASSFNNLDNKSITSLDSETKRSVTDLSAVGAKYATGTLGYDQASPNLLDMAAAEDDEIILQEVIVEQNNIKPSSVDRSDSLQIPGTFASTSEQNSPSKLGKLRGISPKIAPKFPREKLKSMFRKRKLSSILPFHKLRGVRFSKDTKDDDESENESLLNVNEQEAIEVAITLSTPELTDIEKETGIHPYYYTQQTITSARQQAMGPAFPVRQNSLTRSESEEDKISKGYKAGKQIPRSSSLPIIQPTDSTIPLIHDPVIALSLKKLSKARKNKDSPKKVKGKRKSPPLELNISEAEKSLSIKQGDSELTSEPESPTRRNSLPQITLTRCGRKGSEQLDIVSPSTLGPHGSLSSASRTEDSTADVSSATRKAEKEQIQKPVTKTAEPTKDTKTKSKELHSKTKDPPLHQSQSKDIAALKEKTDKLIESKNKIKEPKAETSSITPKVKTTSDKVPAGEDPQTHSKTKKSLDQKFQTDTAPKDDTSKKSQTVDAKQSLPKSAIKQPTTQSKKTSDIGSAKDRSPQKHSIPTSKDDTPNKSQTAGANENVPKSAIKQAATPSKKTSDISSAKDRSPQRHSIPIVAFSEPPEEETLSKEGIDQKSTPKRKSPPPLPTKRNSPPPKRRESISLLAARPEIILSKRGSISSKKIAGISLAPRMSISPRKSPPPSPTTDIPSSSTIGEGLPFPKSDPKPGKKTVPKDSSAPITQKVKIETDPPSHSDSPEDQTVRDKSSEQSSRPPDAPQRHKPRSGSKGNK